MEYRRRRVLLSEIDRQCAFGLMAYDDATAALQKREAERFWYSLQALMAAAGHLKQILWPMPNPSIGWAYELRAALQITDDSPLNQAGLIEDEPPQIGSSECVRSFDSDTSTFTLFGSVYELSPLLTAIAELGHRVKAELQHLREVV
jgi:hypothetical protein